MGHFADRARASVRAGIGLSAAASLYVFASLGVTPVAWAQSVGGKPAAPDAQARSVAHQSYEKGLKLFAAGKYQPAIDQISGALRVGGFSSQDMAKALYTRGLCYKRLDRPGLAISDLTSALWLKNGLGTSDRKNAEAERADAYRMAGLGNGNSGTERVVGNSDAASAAVSQPAATTAPPAAPQALPGHTVSSVESSSPFSFLQNLVSGGSGSQPTPAQPQLNAVPAAAPAASQIEAQANPAWSSPVAAAPARTYAAHPVEGNGLQSVAMQSVINAPSPATGGAGASASGYAGNTSAMPAPIDSAPVAPAQNASGSGIGGFFSNLFSGGTQSASEPATGVTTASTSPVAATSSWSNSTSVASGQAVAHMSARTAQTAATSAAKSAAGAARSARMTKGKYKIHVAALRSRSEAEALAQKLERAEAGALKSRVPVVDEAVIGSMGTFYRVRIGSYKTAEESRSVCNALRAGGFDCLVVTN